MKLQKIASFFGKQSLCEVITYWYNCRVLLYSIGQIILTGISEKSLAILYKGINIKINRRLHKVYSPILNNYNNDSPNITLNVSNNVWVYTPNGIENESILVKKCYQSICAQFKNHEIVVITDENYKQFVHLPNYIFTKIESDVINNENFKELLSIALLNTYGGVWIDATIYCSPLCKIPAFMIESDFFVVQNLKPTSDGSVLNNQTWFIAARKNSSIVHALNTLLWEYWKNDHWLNENILSHFMYIVSLYFVKEWKRIYQYPASLTYILNLSLYNKYKKETFEEILSNCPIHKLNIPLYNDDTITEDSILKHLLNYT